MTSRTLFTQRPRASLSFLQQEYVLVQAWKKATKYVRGSNWYADQLELDISTVLLREMLPGWASAIEALAQGEGKPDPLRLIPAPKRQRTSLSEDLTWKCDQGKVCFRPLAHASIKDQTLAMAFLITLADAAETVQGNTTQSDLTDTNRVVSFGNRLLCDWDDAGSAKFRWGNSDTYRDYYADYRAFIERPRRAEQLLSEQHHSWVEVQTDLSQFYDRISPEQLLDKVEHLLQRIDLPLDRHFVSAFSRLFNWTWNDEDGQLVKEYRDLSGFEADRFNRVALPQGLAVSGFFSNVYLLDFDEKMRELFGKRLPGGRYAVLKDYCRYVDDMRFVFDLGNESVLSLDDEGRQSFNETIAEWLRGVLADQAGALKVNADKTLLLYSSDNSSMIPITATMEQVQRNLSGPLDIATARETLEILEGLFSTASEGDAKADAARNSRSKELELIFTTQLEVRHDTLARFTAYRILSVCRKLRLLTDPEDNEVPRGPSRTELSREVLDRRIEVFAKRMIQQFILDPAHIRLLLVAFDLYPDPLTLAQLIGFLRKHIQGDADHLREVPRAEKSIALYCACELFRAGASQTGFVYDVEELPSSADIAEYRRVLASFAEEVLEGEGATLPWYVRCQALLLLAVTERLQNTRTGAVAEHEFLHDLLREEGAEEAIRRWMEEERPPEVAFALTMVAHHLKAESTRTARLLAAVLQSTPESAKERILCAILAGHPAVAKKLMKVMKERDETFWLPYFRAYGYHDVEGLAEEPLRNGFYPLLDLAHREANPFRQEFCALLLLQELLREWAFDNGKRHGGGALTPSRITLTCKDWQALEQADLDTCVQEGFLSVQIADQAPINDIRYEVPKWYPESAGWIPQVAQVTRAAVTGRPDYTLPRLLPPQDYSLKPYRGIKSSWFKRRFGLFGGRNAFGPRCVPLSPWFVELLGSMLGWPGQQTGEQIATSRHLQSAKKLRDYVKGRIKELSRLYGRASKTVFYDFPVRLKDDREPGAPFNIAIVQTAFPKFDDLRKIAKGNCSDAVLKDQRRHLASVLKAVQKMLDVRRTHAGASHGTVDLVVFPELSIHPRDLYYLQRFVDQEKCAIFCGLVYHPHPYTANALVNSGLWLIPVWHTNGRQFLYVEQGKKHLAHEELGTLVVGYRPCQWILSFQDDIGQKLKLSASICYDATDLRLAADLRDASDCYIVSAYNKDVQTFDAMAGALHYHMYQHVIVANSGEFGGSCAQAPFHGHRKTVVHSHGTEQVAISFASIDMSLYSSRSGPNSRDMKTPPAGYARGKPAKKAKKTSSRRQPNRAEKKKRDKPSTVA